MEMIVTIWNSQCWLLTFERDITMQLNHAPADVQKFAARQEEPLDAFAKCLEPPFAKCLEPPFTPLNA
jgi:hypothetical protein